MPRAGWLKPISDRRLSDLVSVGLLTRVFPPGLVDEVVAACDRTEQRNRVLPARVMTYFAMAMALFADESYEDVLAQLTDGLSWVSGWEESYQPPTKSAIFLARRRLGSEPVEALFRRVARPMAAVGTPGAWLAGRRLVAVDGTCLDLADTVENEVEFGRQVQSTGRNKSAFPQVRVVALAECATHAVLDVSMGAFAQSEVALAGELIDRLNPGTLLLADRYFYSVELWNRAVKRGADLLWRAKLWLNPRFVATLADGSRLAEVRADNSVPKLPATLIRVIDYNVDNDVDADVTDPEAYRLFTTILDPAEAPAEMLAAAYTQRWEIESTFDELKTHQRGPNKVLRSKSPDLVRQEIWGHLCCHYAIRLLMAETAAHAGHDPDRVSFVKALRATRRSVAHQGDFPP